MPNVIKGNTGKILYTEGVRIGPYLEYKVEVDTADGKIGTSVSLNESGLTPTGRSQIKTVLESKIKNRLDKDTTITGIEIVGEPTSYDGNSQYGKLRRL